MTDNIQVPSISANTLIDQTFFSNLIGVVQNHEKKLTTAVSYVKNRTNDAYEKSYMGGYIIQAGSENVSHTLNSSAPTSQDVPIVFRQEFVAKPILIVTVEAKFSGTGSSASTKLLGASVGEVTTSGAKARVRIDAVSDAAIDYELNWFAIGLPKFIS